MTAKMDDISKHLGSVVGDIGAHKDPGERQHFAAGTAEMMGGLAVHELNSALKGMGVNVAQLDKTEKSLTTQGMQDLFDANLNGKDLVDLFKLGKDIVT